MSQQKIIPLIRANSKSKLACITGRKGSKAVKGLMLSDPRIQKLRELREKYRLSSQDLTDLLADQKFIISKNALQQYLQGNVKGTSKKYSDSGRNISVDHITDLYAHVLKIESRLNIELKRYISRDMRFILADWYRRLSISSPSRERKLGAIIDVDYSTIWKWQRDNRYPKSIATVMSIERKVSSHTAQACI
ncbi:hypothetical protein G6692_03690 [Polynucleobacter paneuropaeus]|uniref:Uncharacterized protein n=1 Tax=Polynucleobacter paneuropaeus TaxID=2527775 RepID=A0AAE2YK47_9BURK|nr:hypothetical protein [Polynucleobacter paneuropaeus]MBT8591011.1 hypothetical protein [Polynucleobacter paneuropaeus]MBT8596402.1 hypothetical protein [Polynucleobacter paneuropaeus]MBT8598215.1 hypothetical protein [Polynucleobacter paneuropaeus]